GGVYVRAKTWAEMCVPSAKTNKQTNKMQKNGIANVFKTGLLARGTFQVQNAARNCDKTGFAPSEQRRWGGAAAVCRRRGRCRCRAPACAEQQSSVPACAEQQCSVPASFPRAVRFIVVVGIVVVAVCLRRWSACAEQQSSVPGHSREQSVSLS